SELIDLGYATFYPMIALTALYYFVCRQKEFQSCTWVLVTSFFAYYAIYDLLPVVGPTFYFKAIGLENAAKGIFPSVNDYFNYHQECLVSPGYQEGLFYHLVEDAKAAGERPTAAFPSSHVGIATVCMLLIGHARNRKLLWLLVPFYVFLCLATVYIQAHYVIDAIAGFVSGVAFYFFFMFLGKKVK
ncbi:MAG: phosphatase PAP2 family protein, partial [Prevotella buccalis]|nr:phosphatase PAP2 family protein [Hoylesella buccalis]